MLELSNWLPEKKKYLPHCCHLCVRSESLRLLGIPSTCLAAGQEASGDKLRKGATGGESTPAAKLSARIQ